MDLKTALTNLRIGIRQMPYSHVPYNRLVQSIDTLESKLQSTNTAMIPCSCKTSVTVLKGVDVAKCDNCGATWQC